MKYLMELNEIILNKRIHKINLIIYLLNSVEILNLLLTFQQITDSLAPRVYVIL